MEDNKPAPESRNKLDISSLSEESLDRELVFHYSREHRLAKASPAVQDLHKPGPKKRPNVFSTLTATRSHTFLLVSIIIASVAVSLLSAINKEKGAAKLGGNSIQASASRVQVSGSSEKILYLTIRKSVKNNAQAYTGKVNVAISPAVSAAKNAPPPESLSIKTDRIEFDLKPQQEFGISIPFDAATLVVIMQTDDDHHVLFKVKPK